MLDADQPSNETRDTVLAYWFGSETDDAVTADRQRALWWSKQPVVDAEIRRRFSSCVAAAADGNLDGWRETALGQLALIILTDQFPRNMYRDTPQAFAFDALARRWCHEGIAAEADRALRPIERVFFYLPLEHSEALADQDLSLSLFRELALEATPDMRESFDNFASYAVRHHAVIARFGRFPHRNAILGRPSTQDEAAFLLTPGSSF